MRMAVRKMAAACEPLAAPMHTTDKVHIKGFRVTRPSDVRRVLQAALDHPGPALIDAEVEQHDNVFPMIPAGASHRHMLLGPPKHVLDKPTGGT